MIPTRHLLVLSLFASLGALQAQTTLSDLISQAKADWMIGNWTGETDEGQTVAQSFTWDLNKNAVVTHVKNPNWEAKGMIAVDPATSQVQHFAVTTSGALVRGVWSEESGNVLLKINLQGPEGRSWKGAVLYKNVDADTMQLEMYGLTEAGDLESSPRGQLKFKRKK